MIIETIIIIIIKSNNEEHAMAAGHQSLVEEAAKYAEELNITLKLDTINPVCVTTEGKVVTAARAGRSLKTKNGKESYSVSGGKMRAKA